MNVLIKLSDNSNYQVAVINGIVQDESNLQSYLQEKFNKKEYEIIPDPVPVPLPVPQPDWDGFMADCDDVFAAGMQANYLVFTQVFNMLLALKGKGALDENSPEWRNFAFNYQIGKASLTPEQIAQVESAMANNNIPWLS